MNLNYKDTKRYRISMSEFLKNHFSTYLKDDVKLLNLPNGIDLIRQKYSNSFHQQVA